MDPQTSRRKLKAAIALIVIVILLFVGFEGYSLSRFHVVSTNPATDSVSTLSPFFKINFNKQLVSGSGSLSTDGIVTSIKYSAKTLTLNLSYPLKTNKTYTITINKISDSSGDILNNLNFTFVANNIPYASLPKDEQNALLANQDHYTQPGVNINYINTDDLINNGMSTTQLVLLEQYITEFDKNAKNVTFDPNSIGVYQAPSPYTAEFHFNVNIDGTTYSAQAPYTFLDDLTLILVNQSGATVFNSSTYSAPGGD